MKILVQLLGVAVFLLGFYWLAVWLGLIVTGLVLVVVASGADIKKAARSVDRKELNSE
jgi:hypothetical protein